MHLYQSTLTTINKAIRWWADGLCLLVPVRLRSILSAQKKTLTLSINGPVLSLTTTDKLDATQALHFDLSKPKQRRALENEVKALTKQKPVIRLNVTANWGLCRTLQFPIQATSSLDQIVYYELEKVTPFKPEHIYYAYQILHRDKTTKTLEIEFHAIPKNKLDPLLTQLEKFGLSPDQIVLQHPNAQADINLLPDAQISSTKTSGWRYANIVLIMCALVLFGIQKSLPLYLIEQEIKATEIALKPIRKEAITANTLKTEWSKLTDQNAAVNQQIAAYQPILLLLNEITDLLPNTTWLSDLNIERDQLQLRGESVSASALIPLIEGSDYFKNTRFRSPVMTQSSGKESFQIITHRQKPNRTIQGTP